MSEFKIVIDKDFDVSYGNGNIEDSVFTFESRRFSDDRGDFKEFWKENELTGRFAKLDWVKQCNMSKSKMNVFRGMHAQRGDSSQGKFVSCSNGAVMDVIIDMRPKSCTFRTIKTYYLSFENCLSLWVPRGFLHGFLSLSDNTVFQYLCDSTYDKSSECGANIFSILDDGMICSFSDKCHKGFMSMVKSQFIMSEKDKALPSIVEFEKNELGVTR